MRINLRKALGAGYDNGLVINKAIANNCRYFVFCGARNTKKSVDVMGYDPLLTLSRSKYDNVIIARQNLVDIGDSAFANLVNIIEQNGMSDLFKIKTSPYRITLKQTKQEIIFRGCNNPTSLTSFKSSTGFITTIYFEEASELKSYEDFRKIDGSIRGKLPNGLSLRIVFCMNTWSEEHWIYKTFFKKYLGNGEKDYQYLLTHPYREVYIPNFNLGYGSGLYIHQSTYKINEFRAPDYDKGAEIMKINSPEIFKVEYLGMWGQQGDSVYIEWNKLKDKLIKTPEEIMNMRFSKFAIGIDTGLSNGEGKKRKDGIRSATVMILVGVTEDYGKLVAIDEWFFTNEGRAIPKTQDELLRDMMNTFIMWKNSIYINHPDLMKGMIPVFVDAMLSTKMPIQSRIDFSRLLMGWENCLVSTKCQNLIRELNECHSGENGAPRANTNDHAINAWEYAWAPMRDYITMWKQFKPR